jgi:hypothetical protein
MIKGPGVTIGLWLANAIGWLALILAASYQSGIFRLDAGSVAKMPADLTLAAQPIQLPQPLPDMGKRNPFDATAAHWTTSEATSPAAGNGDLLGFIRLPGVNSALTTTGVVHVGEALAQGKLIGMTDGKVIVEQATGKRAMDLPSARRPTLQSLGKPHPAQNNTTKVSP